VLKAPKSDRVGSADPFGDVIRESNSRNPQYGTEDFWNYDRRLAGILKTGEAAVSPTYFRLPGRTAPLASSIRGFEFDGFITLGIAVTLFGLPLIGGLQYHRKNGPNIPQLSFCDCGKSGGLLIARRKLPLPDWIPHMLRRAGAN